MLRKYSRFLITGLFLVLVTSALAGDFGAPGARIRDGNPIQSGKLTNQTINTQTLILNNNAGAMISFPRTHQTSGQTITTLTAEKLQLYPALTSGMPSSSDTSLGLDVNAAPVFMTPRHFYVNNQTNTIDLDAGSSPASIKTVGGGIAVTWTNGSQVGGESYAPQFAIPAVDEPGILTDANETWLLLFTSAGKIWTDYLKIVVDQAAGACTTAPTYNLVDGSTYGTVINTHVSACGISAANEQTLGSVVTCTGGGGDQIGANRYVWLVTQTAASVCAAKNTISFGYYMSN